MNILTDLGLVQKKETGGNFFDKFRNRIIFPFHNFSGRIVGFGGRRLLESDQPKYLNSPESKIYKKGELLYGLYQAISAIRESQTVIIVEGYFDLLRLVDVGVENVVASSGTALTEAQGRLLKRYTNSVIISYDSDAAGVSAALRNSQILESIGLDVYLIDIPKPHDPDSFILANGKNTYLDLIKEKTSPIEYQIRRFKSENPLPSMEAKNQFIDEIIDTLILIPNDVKVGLSLHRLSQNLEIAESFLISRFNHLKRQRKYQVQNSNEIEEGAIKAAPFRKGQWRAEEGMISLLLLNKTQITKMILHHISASDFENDDLRALFEYISLQWEDLGMIDVKRLNEKFNSQENATVLSKLSLQNIHNTDKFAVDCIYQLRKRSLDLRFNEVKRLMNEESASHDSVLHYLKELTAIRNKLSEIEKERSRHFKVDL
jgi:DNA primase